MSSNRDAQRSHRRSWQRGGGRRTDHRSGCGEVTGEAGVLVRISRPARHQGRSSMRVFAIVCQVPLSSRASIRQRHVSMKRFARRCVRRRCVKGPAHKASDSLAAKLSTASTVDAVDNSPTDLPANSRCLLGKHVDSLQRPSSSNSDRLHGSAEGRAQHGALTLSGEIAARGTLQRPTSVYAGLSVQLAEGVRRSRSGENRPSAL